MKALVTGATGFIGGNLMRELLRQGIEVRALVRNGRDTSSLAELGTETCRGDLCDASSLDQAVAGCDVVFHVAAQYSFWVPDVRAMYETNVGGTRRLLEAALRHGVKKVVYTSSVATLAIPGDGRPGTEEREASPQDLIGHYKRSKFLAERVALEMCQKGLLVVVVNPSTPVGPGDVKPTPTGKIILDFLRRRMPAYVDTGLNLVHVNDVAKGHILAWQRGKVGERYILGNRNLSLQQILGMLEKIAGIPAPRLRLPLWLALGAAYGDELLSRLRSCPPRVPVVGVKMAAKHMYFDASRAVRELGLPQTPVEQALEQAVHWFREKGYV